MLARSPRRPLAAHWLVILSFVLTACAGPAAAPTAAPTASQSPTSPSASASVAGECLSLNVDELLAAAAARDGQAVCVSGDFVAFDRSAQLCEMLLESYPPQCGGGSVRLTGEVPADTLATLDATSQVGMNQVWWGYVSVKGTFRASGADGRPLIEMSEIFLAG